LLHDPDVAALIADQRMPEMLGTELLACAAATQPQVVRLLFTGYTDIGTLVDAINAGHVFAYITKPWEPDGLRLLVRRALERFDVEADRRRLLGEWQQTCEELRAARERQVRLLALAGHELRTPVHQLTAALDLLAAQPVSPSAAPWLDTARQAAVWLGRAVRQLHMALAWSSTAPSLDLRPTAPAALVDDLAARFAPIAARRGLRLVPGDASRSPAVVVDRRWIGHALGALVSNAIRCTPDGGRIDVDVAVADDRVALVVRDDGIGIDPQRLEKIFEPFSTPADELDGHSSGAFEFGSRGLGLGLATAAAIAQAHGGRLDVASTPKCGSTFTLVLPLPN